MVTICRCGCPRPPPPLSRKKKKHRPPCDDGSLPPRRAARDWIFLPPADDAVDVGVTSVEMASAMVRLAQIMINENGLSSRARDGETTSLISKRRVPILPARWWWGGGEENAGIALAGPLAAVSVRVWGRPFSGGGIVEDADEGCSRDDDPVARRHLDIVLH